MRKEESRNKADRAQHWQAENVVENVSDGDKRMTKIVKRKWIYKTDLVGQ